MVLTEANKIFYASIFLTGTNAVWWFLVFRANIFLRTLAECSARVVAEFVTAEHVRLSRHRLRKLRHDAFVSKHLSDF